MFKTFVYIKIKVGKKDNLKSYKYVLKLIFYNYL